MVQITISEVLDAQQAEAIRTNIIPLTDYLAGIGMRRAHFRKQKDTDNTGEFHCAMDMLYYPDKVPAAEVALERLEDVGEAIKALTGLDVNTVSRNQHSRVER